MASNLDILLFLASLEGPNRDDHIYLYESHMGSLFGTYKQREIGELYCEACGDYDWEIESGVYGDLLNEYAERVEQQRADIEDIRVDILNNIDIQKILRKYSKPTDPKYADCNNCETEGVELIDVLYGDYSRECKACVLEIAIDDMLMI